MRATITSYIQCSQEVKDAVRSEIQASDKKYAIDVVDSVRLANSELERKSDQALREMESSMRGWKRDTVKGVLMSFYGGVDDLQMTYQAYFTK